MKQGDLVQWNYGAYQLNGILVKKTGVFRWEVYFSKINKVSQLPTSELIKMQQETEEK